MRKIQIVDGYKYNTKERMNEIFNTILWNSKIFDKIFIVCEKPEYYNSYKFIESDIVEVVNLNKNEFISIQEMFEFLNTHTSPDDIKFLSNIDSIYTEKIKTIEVENDFVYSFTNRSLRNPNINDGFGHISYVRSENDGLVMFNRDNVLDPTWFEKDEELLSRGAWAIAVCGWAWKTVRPLIYDEACFQCYPQAEQCMMTTFTNSGYNLKSAAIKFPSFHNHGSDEKTENNYKSSHRHHGAISAIL